MESSQRPQVLSGGKSDCHGPIRGMFRARTLTYQWYHTSHTLHGLQTTIARIRVQYIRLYVLSLVYCLLLFLPPSSGFMTGKKITSRMCRLPANNITNLSTPSPHPPVGGNP